jgi:hypothetical protein
MNSPLLVLGFSIIAAAVARAELSIHTDFENGSGKVVRLDQAAATIRLMPGGQITRGWPCWWHVRIEGATPGQEITLELVPSQEKQVQPGAGKGKPLSANWSRPERPAISFDGKTWRHGEPGALSAEAMTYRIKAETPTLWVAWGPVFTPTMGRELIEAAARKAPYAKPFILAKTREGREVPAIRIAEGAEKPVIWLQARQHAWESGSSWVGAGILEWLISEDPLAKELRDEAEIVFVPVMDVDHVTSGDGGKDALPQDHNRDWKDEPHWPEVAAAQKLLRAYGQAKRLRVFCDLHNPGAGNKKAFFFVSPKDMMTDTAWEIQRQFFELARQEFAGNPIPLEIVPQESGASYHPLWKQISKNWVHHHCGGEVVSVTLETAWNTPGSHVEGYRATGAALGRALSRFISGGPIAVSE